MNNKNAYLPSNGDDAGDLNLGLGSAKKTTETSEAGCDLRGGKFFAISGIPKA